MVVNQCSRTKIFECLIKMLLLLHLVLLVHYWDASLTGSIFAMSYIWYYLDHCNCSLCWSSLKLVYGLFVVARRCMLAQLFPIKQSWSVPCFWLVKLKNISYDWSPCCLFLWTTIPLFLQHPWPLAQKSNAPLFVVIYMGSLVPFSGSYASKWKESPTKFSSVFVADLTLFETLKYSACQSMFIFYVYTFHSADFHLPCIFNFIAIIFGSVSVEMNWINFILF